MRQQPAVPMPDALLLRQSRKDGSREPDFLRRRRLRHRTNYPF